MYFRKLTHFDKSLEVGLEGSKTGGKKTSQKTVTRVQVQDDEHRTEGRDSEHGEKTDFTFTFFFFSLYFFFFFFSLYFLNVIYIALIMDLILLCFNVFIHLSLKTSL